MAIAASRNSDVGPGVMVEWSKVLEPAASGCGVTAWAAGALGLLAG